MKKSVTFLSLLLLVPGMACNAMQLEEKAADQKPLCERILNDLNDAYKASDVNDKRTRKVLCADNIEGAAADALKGYDFGPGAKVLIECMQNWVGLEDTGATLADALRKGDSKYFYKDDRREMNRREAALVAARGAAVELTSKYSHFDKVALQGILDATIEKLSGYWFASSTAWMDHLSDVTFDCFNDLKTKGTARDKLVQDKTMQEAALEALLTISTLWKNSAPDGWFSYSARTEPVQGYLCSVPTLEVPQALTSLALPASREVAEEKTDQ